MNTPTALGLLAPARLTREKVEDFEPLLVFAPRKGNPVLMSLNGQGTLVELLDLALTQIRRELGPAEWIAITSDAYVKDLPDGEVPPSERLEEAFLSGDPTVTEQMVVVLLHRYKGIDSASQTYRYLPSEGWEWGPETSALAPTGGVVETLRKYM